jgi:hypothetical protein
MTEVVHVNKKQGQKIKCTCRVCRRATKHEILADVAEHGSVKPSSNFPYEYYWVSEYQILQCQGCETLSFRRTNSNSEDSPVEIATGEWEGGEVEDIYPSPIEGRTPVSDAILLPEKVERIYEETLSALNNRQQVLCGVGIRAIIETICKDKQAVGVNLYERIKSLVNLGVLTQDGADILNKLRLLGNDAAHEVKPHKLQELGFALDVVDHLLLGVYILPFHAQETLK